MTNFQRNATWGEMTNFPWPGPNRKNLEIALRGGHGKYLSDNCIFQYFQHSKSKNFPPPRWDIHIPKQIRQSL